MHSRMNKCGIGDRRKTILSRRRRRRASTRAHVFAAREWQHVIGNNQHSSSSAATTTNGDGDGDGDGDGHEDGEEGIVSIARLNHGSFGACPRRVLLEQDKIRQEWLANPDEFYFSGRLVNMIQKSSQRAADTLLGLSQSENRTLFEDRTVQDFREECCLVENATVAAAAVFQRWSEVELELNGTTNREAPSVILCLDCSYSAVKIALNRYCQRLCGMRIETIHVPFASDSINDKGSFEEFKSQLYRNMQLQLDKHRPKYIILDHITSQPALKLPIAEMVSICRNCESVVEIAVDASHAIGNLIYSEKDPTPIEIDADYYWTNIHKWAFAPHSVCALHTRKLLHHPIVSWDAGKPRGIVDEIWTGTRDYSSMLVVPHAMDYLDEVDASGMGARRNRDRVWEEGEALAKAWGTPWPVQPLETASGMVMVMIPDEFAKIAGIPGARGSPLMAQLSSANIQASVGLFKLADDTPQKAFLRLSHAIYNTPDDYRRLRDALNTFPAISENE